MRLLAIVALAVASVAAQSVDEVLAWLPADTETLIVAQAEFKMGDNDKSRSLSEFSARAYIQTPFAPGLAKDWETVLEGRAVRWGLVAARRFREPPRVSLQCTSLLCGDAILGMMQFDGCGYYVFAEPVSVVGERQERIDGNEVSVRRASLFPSAFRAEAIDYFAVSLSPVQWLICTDRSFLSEVLQRRPTVKQRAALPPELPEWSFIDRSAPVWGIRHYAADPGQDRTHPRRGTEFPDEGYTGVVLEVTDHVQARWISHSADYWRSMAEKDNEFQHRAEFTQLHEGVWQIEVREDIDAMVYGVFVFMTALGFGIAM